MNEAVFDSMASEYDAVFTHSRIGAIQRKFVWDYLGKSVELSSETRVLELNCGTGEDAIRFAKRGCRVLATDISEKMLNVARQKAQQEGLEHLIDFQLVDLSELKNSVFKNQFDIVFSNFGGLNCIGTQELEHLSSELTELLTQNGRFISVVMPEKGMMESLYFLAKLDLKSAFRRGKKQVKWTNDAGQETTIFYYSPNVFYSAFKQQFTRVSLKPIGFTVPPSYTESFFQKRKWILDTFEWIDQRFSFSTLASVSDHYLIDLKAKN